MDVRPGGRWRLGQNLPGGGSFAFVGEFLEVRRPELLVRTEAPEEAPPGPPAVETVTLEDLGDGRTKVRWEARFPSAEILEFALSTGMTKGALEQLDRLAGLLPGLG